MHWTPDELYACPWLPPCPYQAAPLLHLMFFNLQNLCSPGPQSTSLFILGTWWLSGLQCNGLGFQDWAAIFAQRLNAMSYSWFQTGHKKIRNLASFIGPVSLITAWSCQWLTHSVLSRLNWDSGCWRCQRKTCWHCCCWGRCWWQLCNSLATAFHSLDTVFYLIKTQC